MLNALVRFSLRFRGVVVALACLLFGYGIYVSFHAKLDVFPNFVQPQVVIQTESPGLSPEQVEVLVTRPVETAINGLGGMESMRSESIEGLSIVTAVFEEGTDVFLARQMLGELMLPHLKLSDRLAEGGALFAVGNRHLQRFFHRSDCSNRRSQPLALEVMHRVIKPLTDFTQDVALRDAAPVKEKFSSI